MRSRCCARAARSCSRLRRATPRASTAFSPSSATPTSERRRISPAATGWSRACSGDDAGRGSDRGDPRRTGRRLPDRHGVRPRVHAAQRGRRPSAVGAQGSVAGAADRDRRFQHRDRWSRCVPELPEEAVARARQAAARPVHARPPESRPPLPLAQRCESRDDRRSRAEARGPGPRRCSRRSESSPRRARTSTAARSAAPRGRPGSAPRGGVRRSSTAATCPELLRPCSI